MFGAIFKTCRDLHLTSSIPNFLCLVSVWKGRATFQISTSEQQGEARNNTLNSEERTLKNMYNKENRTEDGLAPVFPFTTTDGSGTDTRRMRQLYNRHGYNLAIFPGGFVKGVRDAYNPYSVLEEVAVDVGELRLRGVETDLFLCMDKHGKLKGVEGGEDEGTVFIQRAVGAYLAFLSRKYAHMGWHVGIKKSGLVKPGHKTWYPWGQHAILFLLRKPYAVPHPLKQLENKHGFRLCILSDGNIEGVSDSFSKFCVLELLPGPDQGSVRIRGVEAGLYLAMNRKGDLYGEKERNHESTLFLEHTDGGSITYLSARWAHLGWYVGIKRSGKPKNGKKTVLPSNQKAIQFNEKPPYPSPSAVNAGFGKEISTPIVFIDEDESDENILGL